MNKRIDITQMTPEKLGISRYTPEPAVEREFRNALAYLVFKWQFFAQIIYSDMPLVFTRHPVVPIAATDSHSIFLNPDGFKEHGINDVLEIVFVLAHEVEHRVLYDVVQAMMFAKAGRVPLANGKWLPYDDNLAGCAMDYRNNAILVNAKIGRMPKVGLYDPKISMKGMESWIEIYEKLWKSATKIILPPGFDRHLYPSQERIDHDRGRREQSIVAAAQLAERTGAGDIPAGLKRVLNDILDPKIPWQNHLRASMRRKAGEPRLDWSKINRRLAGRPDPLYFPGMGRRGAGVIVCGADNSGSIGQHVANVFGAEMSGIVSDIRPSQLIVMWCDAAVTRVDVIDDPENLTSLFADWKTTGIGGGGGTDFRPVFDKIKEMELEPDMLVYFTDMYGRFPSEQPPYSVIWASTTASAVAPFGESIHVEI